MLCCRSVIVFSLARLCLLPFAAAEGQSSNASSPSLRGSVRCEAEGSICGSHGQRTAFCCPGLECQSLLGSASATMQCVRSWQPTPSPPPAQCTAEGSICGSNGQQTAPCCPSLECQSLTGGAAMQCVRREQPTPFPTPFPPFPPSPPQPSNFEFRWAGQGDTCMDVAGGRGTNFNKIQVWACQYPQNQRFTFAPLDPYSGSGQIKWARDPRKCLDVKDGVTSNFAQIVLYDCHYNGHRDFGNQVFSVDAFAPVVNEGSTYIRWKNKCVDLKDGVVGSPGQTNSQLITYDCHSPQNREWVNQQWNVNYVV